MKLVTHKILGLVGLLLLAGPVLAAVDDMPVPKAAPRTKVAQQKLDNNPAKGGRVLTGAVKLFEGDKLRVGDTDIRLYGIVVPQQTSQHSVEARASLVRLLSDPEVSCRVLERDRSFRLLAQCRSAKNDDIALAMLQQGWALVARSVVAGTEFSDIYLAAENKAQVQKLGLWAPAEVKVAAGDVKNVAATVPPGAITTTAAIPPSAAPPPPIALAPAANAALPTVEKLAEKIVAVAAPSPVVANLPVVAKNETPPNQNSAIPNQLPVASDLSGPFPLLSQDQMIAWLWFAGMTPALVMILFALGQIALRRYEYQQERRTLAAALRGELLAARAICTTRAEALAYDTDLMTGKASALWPRLRANVYAAHIGRIGLLGADLARKVSSLYGQFSDYAQYYTPRAQAESPRSDATGVQQSLFTLIDHIEETLNNLQAVENSGHAYRPTPVARRAAAVPVTPRQRVGQTVVNAETAGQLEYVAVEEAEEQARPTRPVLKPLVKAKEKTAEEKIADATSAMMEMLIAEQDDGDNDMVVTLETKGEKSAKAEDGKGDGKTKKGGKPGVVQGNLPLKADAVAEVKPEAKPDAKFEVAKTVKAVEAVEKLEAKAEYYDFRSQAINIARG